MKPKLNSNASIFADRGDPWVSEKQGLTEFGRALDTEDAKFDHYFARRAPEKVEPPSEERGKGRDRTQMRLINSRRKLAEAMKPKRVIKPKVIEHPIRPEKE